ncbi:actin-binding FH2, partial [Clavulina sp. PMI_390]
NVQALAKADQYFYQLIQIPNVARRLECMIFRRRLDLDIADVRPELRIVRTAAMELRESAKLKKLLQLVLAVGNALNASSFRGGAHGFRLDALLKLKETKTARAGSDCPTLLHYLARLMGRADPSLITFIDDLPHLEAAARVSVQTVLASITSVTAGYESVQTAVKDIDTSAVASASDDRFSAVMKVRWLK